MRPKVATKAGDVLSQLKPYVEGLATIDPFTLKRYKREVEESLSIDAHFGSVVMGLLCVFEFDEAGVDAWLNRALALSDDSWTRYGYASALQLLGKFRQAAYQAAIASDKVPENLTYLSNAIVFAHNAGLFEKASELVDKFNLRSPNALHPDTELTTDVRSSIASLGIAPDMAERCNAIAFEILRNHRVAFRDTAYKYDREDETIMYHIGIVCSIEKVESLDDELGCALFEQVPDFNPGKYWVGYEKARIK